MRKKLLVLATSALVALSSFQALADYSFSLDKKNAMTVFENQKATYAISGNATSTINPKQESQTTEKGTGSVSSNGTSRGMTYTSSAEISYEIYTKTNSSNESTLSGSVSTSTNTIYSDGKTSKSTSKFALNGNQNIREWNGSIKILYSDGAVLTATINMKQNVKAATVKTILNSEYVTKGGTTSGRTINEEISPDNIYGIEPIIYYMSYNPYITTSSGTSGVSVGYSTDSSSKISINKVNGLNLKNKAGRKVAVKWKKESKVSGYQIQYAANKNFKNAKTVNVAKAKSSKIISNLKKGKTYFFRIRAYKKINGKKSFSGWSSSKRIKIKR